MMATAAPPKTEPAKFTTKDYRVRNESSVCVDRLINHIGRFASRRSLSTCLPTHIHTPTPRQRPLHWVFKIGDLKKTLDFYEGSFGMHVHRHEEFASGCEATCNGPYGGSWSKTMVGYGQEDENYALELTANVRCSWCGGLRCLRGGGAGGGSADPHTTNFYPLSSQMLIAAPAHPKRSTHPPPHTHTQYGIDSYAQGNDLRYIAIDAAAYKGPADKVETDAAGRKFVASPDGYKYMLVDTGATAAPKEPFLFVSIHVSDLEKSKKVRGCGFCGGVY
jgi:catechol 2,3-dioxygenase-like lactoylglutathione lyase family enzyme